MEDSAWLTVHELASDLTDERGEAAIRRDGLQPASVTWDGRFREVREGRGEECTRLGISIVGGHTGKYPGSDFSVVGGGMMMGIAAESDYVTPRMMQEGDDVIMTKGSAIEATAVLARAFPATVEAKLRRESLAETARGYFRLAPRSKTPWSPVRWAWRSRA